MDPAAAAAAGAVGAEGAGPWLLVTACRTGTAHSLQKFACSEQRFLFQNVCLTPMPGGLKSCCPSTQWIGAQLYYGLTLEIHRNRSLLGCWQWLHCVTVWVKTVGISVSSPSITNFICLHRQCRFGSATVHFRMSIWLEVPLGLQTFKDYGQAQLFTWGISPLTSTATR